MILRNFKSTNEALEIFKNDSLLHPPGIKYQYTTFGFTLIAAVIEGISKKSFLNFLQEEVFNPLKIKSATADFQNKIISNRVGFYDLSPKGNYYNSRYINSSYKWAGGGLLSSAEDLTKFGSAHLDGKFISHKTLKEMFTTQKTFAGKETNVGIAWRINKGFWGEKIIHHEGSMSGARSAILIYPEQELVITLLSNLSQTPLFAFETAQIIAEPFLKKNYSIKTKLPYDIEGVYDIKGVLNGRELTGNAKITKNRKKNYAGIVEIGKTKMIILDTIKNSKGYNLILTHPQGGLLLFPFLKNGDKFQTGKVSITASNFSFTMSKK